MITLACVVAFFGGLVGLDHWLHGRDEPSVPDGTDAELGPVGQE